MLAGLQENGIVTAEQLTRIEEYLLQHQDPEKEKSSQKREAEDGSSKSVQTDTKRRVEKEDSVKTPRWMDV